MRKITNPNFIYIIVFIIPFLVYSLEWSTIYPVLRPELFGFYIFTFLIAFLVGMLIDRTALFIYKPIPVYRHNLSVVIALYIFYCFDFYYSGYIPLFAFSSGQASYGGSINYGIPTIHVLFLTFHLFFSLHLFHQFISNKKFSLLVLYILTFVPFIFLLQRSGMMFVIIGSAFLFFISQKRISKKKVLSLVIFALSILYIFGFLGNLRSSNGDPTFIPRASGATEEFLNSSIPKEFYWSYLYIASPVANLQNNINIEQNVYPDYLGFVVFEMMPDFISKKVANIFSLTRREFYQINSFLNVGTIYARPFSFLSWGGMFAIFIYLMLLMNLYYVLMRKSYMFGATSIAMMFTIIALGNFDNPIAYSAFGFSLFYPFLLSIVRGLRIRVRTELKSEASLRLMKGGLAV